MADAYNPQDGTRISFDVAGEGPALVFLHGSALSRVVWRGLGYLKGLPGYTHVRIDARGHGRSEKPHDAAAYAPELMVGDVLAVVDQLGIQRAGIVGYSMGARTGWQLVTNHPERVAAFVAMGGSHRAQGGEISKIFFPGYLEALRSGDIDAFVEGFGPGLDPNTKAAFRNNDPLALAAFFALTESGDSGIPDLAVRGVRVPTLLIAGTADERRYADALDEARMLPRGSFAGLPGRSHAGTLASVADVLAAVVPFLDREYPPAP